MFIQGSVYNAGIGTAFDFSLAFLHPDFEVALCVFDLAQFLESCGLLAQNGRNKVEFAFYFFGQGLRSFLVFERVDRRAVGFYP